MIKHYYYQHIVSERLQQYGYKIIFSSVTISPRRFHNFIQIIPAIQRKAFCALIIKHFLVHMKAKFHLEVHGLTNSGNIWIIDYAFLMHVLDTFNQIKAVNHIPVVVPTSD